MNNNTKVKLRDAKEPYGEILNFRNHRRLPFKFDPRKEILIAPYDSKNKLDTKHIEKRYKSGKVFEDDRLDNFDLVFVNE